MAKGGYLAERIQAALREARGNPTQAQRVLIRMAATDDLLLRELVRPHIKGIVAHAVGRAVGTKVVAPKASSTGAAPAGLSADGLNAILSQLDSNFASETSGSKETLPAKGPDHPLLKGETIKNASPRHAATMRTIAASFRQVPRRKNPES